MTSFADRPLRAVPKRNPAGVKANTAAGRAIS